MERWSGKRLKNSAIYGVRVYRRGSMLHNHVDRSDTHIISAIVNVAQQVCRAGGCHVSEPLRRAINASFLIVASVRSMHATPAVPCSARYVAFRWCSAWR